MNKVIHAAVRRDFTRLGAALGTARDGDRRRAADLGRAWGNLRDQLHHHHQQEDTILFPTAVRLGADAGLVEALEAEHQAMGRALAEIDEAMGSYATSGSAEDAADAGDAVRRGTAVVDQHLAHEEGELEPIVLAWGDAPEWREAMHRVRQQPPRSAGWFFAWLEDGGPEEAQRYLAHQVPRPVRLVFGRVLGRGYHRTVAPVWR